MGAATPIPIPSPCPRCLLLPGNVHSPALAQGCRPSGLCVASPPPVLPRASSPAPVYVSGVVSLVRWCTPGNKPRGQVLSVCSHFSAPFDRITEINFNIDADEDSVSPPLSACWRWTGNGVVGGQWGGLLHGSSEGQAGAVAAQRCSV